MFYKRNGLKKFFFLTIFVAIFFVFNHTYASFFHFAEEISRSGDADVKRGNNFNNSQNMPLLESFLSYDAVNPKGGGDIIVVNNNSLLPELGMMGTVADIDDNSDQISIYEVRESDNVSQIAKMFNVSVNTIIWSNNIERGVIRTGQILVILPISGVKYEIKKGDSLKSIAKKLNGDIDEIIKYNDISKDNQLAEGQIIIIPNGEMAPSVSPRMEFKSSPARGANGPYYANYYIRPIGGGSKTQGLHGYNGVDLANVCGAPVVASASGDVIISRTNGWNGGYGNYIVISHANNTQTLYAHLSSNIVSAGWRVTQGQVIGRIGSTGRSTGCHVHFEIRGAKNPF